MRSRSPITECTIQTPDGPFVVRPGKELRNLVRAALALQGRFLIGEARVKKVTKGNYWKAILGHWTGPKAMQLCCEAVLESRAYRLQGVMDGTR